MKRNKVLIFLLIFFSFKMYCSAKTIHFNIEPFYTLMSGTFGEYVYENNIVGELKKLSYLEWVTKPLINIGIKNELTINNFLLNTQINTSLNKRCGKMFDSDWINLDDVKNIYSISDNTVNNSFNISLFGGYSIINNFKYSFTPLLGIEYSTISFSSSNAYGWYGDSYSSATGTDVPYNSEDAKYYPVDSGLCSIDYEKKSFYLWIGTENKFHLGKYFIATTEFLISPYTYICSLDKHFKNLEKTVYNAYNDIMESNLSFFKFKFNMQFLISNSTSCNFLFLFLTGNSAIGITQAYSSLNQNYVQIISSKSKSSVEQYQFSLSFKIRFF